MKLAIRTLAVTATLACMVPAASADILNFDDLKGLEFFSSPYHGFTFNSAVATGAWFWSDDNSAKNYYKSASTSLSTDAYGATTPGVSQTIVSATPVVFDGAWFTVLDDAIDVTFKLYRSGSLVGASTIQLDYSDPSTFLASGYGGLVDTIVVEGYQGYFALDDFTFHAPEAHVPEPSSYALTLAALGGMGLMSRRRRNKA